MWAILLAMQMTVALEPTARPKVTAQEVARGKVLFEAQCAYCHGADGDGGRGANLARPVLRHASTDEALFRVVNRGITGTGMPGNAMSTRETWQVVAYVRSLGRVKHEPLPGDAARGANVYESAGCGACHTIRGRGGPMGPDLTDVGARSSPAFLRRSLVDPQADVPGGFKQVRIVTRDGRRLAGVRVNEDTFSIQFRDTAGQLYSFYKDELAEPPADAGRAAMPSFRDRLEPAALDDLVAYLVSLEGAR
ncbi:MAG TPA: c-type cytochrome [Vicinamibacterales bacterium]|jgi:putative heme-binding domain-containing protein